MMMRILVVIALGTTSLLVANDEPKEKAEVTKTERIDFPPGGTLRLTNSVGILTVEAWDRPEMEITTTQSTKVTVDARDRDKATHLLESVHVMAERKGDEVVVTTTFPYRRFPPPYPFDKEVSFYPVARDVNFDLEYRIKVPGNARIIVNHSVGQVNIDGLISDIQVTLLQGEILLHLPEEERYAIHARSDFGHVDSDFPGQKKRLRWVLGHRIVNEDSAATHKLNLRVKYGNIVILKTRVPKAPEPLIPAPKVAGL
jgi:hypothetical protein